MSQVIYLDYNATTPIAPEVAKAMMPYLNQYFGNPSSTHKYGVEARMAVENAREQVATMLGCQSSEVLFTSGGTESNNTAIKGYALANKNKGRHIITSAIEHPAVSEVCEWLREFDFEISYIPVDKQGIVILEALEKAIRTDTILISIMHSNNETGVLQPIRRIAEIAHKYGIALHTDASQSVGKQKLDVKVLGVDMLTIAGHKFYAPKGIGALYIKNGIVLSKIMHGADHEKNRRAGTENLLEISGLGAAAELVNQHLDKYMHNMKQTRDYLWELLSTKLTNVSRNGNIQSCLPNTLSLSFENIEANTLLSELTSIAASAGAACHSDRIDVSHVLQAMHVPITKAMGTIRFSTGRETTMKDIEMAANEIIVSVNKLSNYKEVNISNLSTDKVFLTQYTHGLGCACKIRPQYLERVLRTLTPPVHANILVGSESADDAAVYLMTEDVAIVQTVDFFTPMVDDPYTFGLIAAANSLSDIYAMGGTPLFALNLVEFPDNRLPENVLQEILKGAEEKAHEAGIFILGGHTVEGTEPKFGMSVTGKIHPKKIWRNNTAQKGDKLILTKRIGTGIISTAIKRKFASEQSSREAILSMCQLNALAAHTAQNYTIHAATDITGFGLLGHLLEMSKGSQLTAVIHYSKIPQLPELEKLVQMDAIPGGTKNNLEYVSKYMHWAKNISENQKYILADAQTSGGLLFAVAPEEADLLYFVLINAGLEYVSIIGEFTESSEGDIWVN